jgi:hypothetical protein
MTSNCHPRSQCRASLDLRAPRAAERAGSFGPLRIHARGYRQWPVHCIGCRREPGFLLRLSRHRQCDGQPRNYAPAYPHGRLLNENRFVSGLAYPRPPPAGALRLSVAHPSLARKRVTGFRITNGRAGHALEGELLNRRIKFVIDDHRNCQGFLSRLLKAWGFLIPYRGL